MELFLFILIAAAIILVLLFTFGFFCFLYLLHRSNNERPDRQKPINTAGYGEHEEKIKKAFAEYDATHKQICSTTSKDGLTLFASFIPAKEKTDKLIIAFHGYRSSAKADFSPVFRQLLDNGYSLLLVDQRAHGRSDGTYIGFGALEKDDAFRWCNYATERFGQNVKIYLYGTSMGAATVTMAAGSYLPSTVKGVIADCGFSSPLEIVEHVFKNKKKIPPYPILYFVNFWTRLIAGYNLKKHSSEKAIKKSRLPFLIIHGSEDSFVPTEMSRSIYKARTENTRLVIVDGAAHVRSHLVNEQLYIAEIVKFIENN